MSNDAFDLIFCGSVAVIFIDILVFVYLLSRLLYWKGSASSLKESRTYYRDTLESLHKRGMIRKEQKRGSDGRWVK